MISAGWSQAHARYQVRAGWRDIADPTFREREYIAVKIVLFSLSGYIPAGDEGSMSNDLFLRLQMGTNETCELARRIRRSDWQME